MEDIAKALDNAVKNYWSGMGLLHSASDTFGHIEDLINKSMAIRSLSGSLTRA